MTLTLGTAPLASAAPLTTNFTIDGPQHKLLFSAFPRRIRAQFAGQMLVDTDAAMQLHESNIFPVLYLPLHDVATEFLTKSDLSTHCPFKGDASYWTVEIGDRIAENAVWAYESPIDEASWLAGYVAIQWDLMDHWFDEDDEIFGHIRDPYHRVDARPTSRRVQVRIGGQLVANSTAAFVVSETGFPNQYYFPAADIDSSQFESSPTLSHCPHKGDAVYWSHSGSEATDVAWSYPHPLEEATRVAGYWSFDRSVVETSVDR